MAKKKITHKILVPTKDGGYVNFNDLSEEQKQHIRNQCFTRFADSYMGQLGYTRKMVKMLLFSMDYQDS